MIENDVIQISLTKTNFKLNFIFPLASLCSYLCQFARKKDLECLIGLLAEMLEISTSINTIISIPHKTTNLQLHNIS